jgi:hypothetical protein
MPFVTFLVYKVFGLNEENGIGPKILVTKGIIEIMALDPLSISISRKVARWPAKAHPT